MVVAGGGESACLINAHGSCLQVAVKVPLDVSADQLVTLLVEARVLHALAHPRIVAVEAVAVHYPTAQLCMEFMRNGGPSVRGCVCVRMYVCTCFFTSVCVCVFASSGVGVSAYLH